ncbi:hypothetical protein ERJ75_001167700 [Trypanosoma vivax]|nr:hypothetical protein ERJ75_001167500 [Trypanosoma vivax]KAH8609716.1 hypothetical protein ERJ75_001167700 [Trypanosoma vivax]
MLRGWCFVAEDNAKRRPLRAARSRVSSPMPSACVHPCVRPRRLQLRAHRDAADETQLAARNTREKLFVTAEPRRCARGARRGQAIRPARRARAIAARKAAPVRPRAEQWRSSEHAHRLPCPERAVLLLGYSSTGRRVVRGGAREGRRLLPPRPYCPEPHVRTLEVDCGRAPGGRAATQSAGAPIHSVAACRR